MNKRSVGTEYEQMACEYLVNQGLVIVETNYRVKIGEIDIIAKDKDTICFIEVKYRKSKAQGGAFYAISAKKKQTITRVANWYITSHKLPQNAFYRFDAVLIDGQEVSYVKNAW